MLLQAFAGNLAHIKWPVVLQVQSSCYCEAVSIRPLVTSKLHVAYKQHVGQLPLGYEMHFLL
jgi:hypothetical protein